MPMSFLFWAIFVFAVLFGGYVNWPASKDQAPRFSWIIVIMVLIFLLGWDTFGPTVQGR